MQNAHRDRRRGFHPAFSALAVDRLPSLELVEALGEIEGHPWADWKGGKLITPNALAVVYATGCVTRTIGGLIW